MITSVTYKLKIFCTLFMPSFQLLFLAVKHWSRSQDFARFVSFDAGRPWRWVRHESLLSKSVRAVENNDVHPRNKQFPWIGILLRDIFDSLSIYIYCLRNAQTRPEKPCCPRDCISRIVENQIVFLQRRRQYSWRNQIGRRRILPSWCAGTGFGSEICDTSISWVHFLAVPFLLPPIQKSLFFQYLGCDVRTVQKAQHRSKQNRVDVEHKLKNHSFPRDDKTVALLAFCRQVYFLFLFFRDLSLFTLRWWIVMSRLHCLPIATGLP